MSVVSVESRVCCFVDRMVVVVEAEYVEPRAKSSAFSTTKKYMYFVHTIYTVFFSLRLNKNRIKLVYHSTTTSPSILLNMMLEFLKDMTNE